MYFPCVLYNLLTRQVDDNPTTGPDKSTRKFLVDRNTISVGIGPSVIRKLLRLCYPMVDVNFIYSYIMEKVTSDVCVMS